MLSRTHPLKLVGSETRPALSIAFGYPDADTLVVTPAGEADVATTPSLRQALGEAAALGRPRVIVELDGLTFIDASTLGVLVDARHRITASGGTLHVRCATDHGRRVLAICDLDGMLISEA